MLQIQRKFLEDHGVFFHAKNEQIHFGAGPPAELALEPNCEIRAGRFDIGHVGAFSYFGGGNTILRNVRSIGRFCALAANVQTGAVEHPTDFLSPHNILQGYWNGRTPELTGFSERNADMIEKSRNRYLSLFAGEPAKVVIGHDVWIGEGSFIRRGVTIGHGAIIGARTVVTKDVAPYDIVGGAPARAIRSRFTPDIVRMLLDLNWWDYGLSALEGVDFTNISSAIVTIERNISEGIAELYEPQCAKIGKDGTVSVEGAPSLADAV